MAYKDWNGNITIDEVAAEADIRKAAEAEVILREAESVLKALAIEAEEFQGDTARAIAEKTQELLMSIGRILANLENAQSYTRQVVVRYRKLDQEIKEALERSLRGK